MGFLWLPYYPRLGGLKQHNLFSHSTGGQSLKLRYWQGHTSSGGRRGNSFLAHPAPVGCRRFSICGHITPIPAPLLKFSPPLLSLIVFCLPLVRTLVFGFRAHLDNLGWSHLSCFNLTTSVKILFPNKMAFVAYEVLGLFSFGRWNMGGAGMLLTARQQRKRLGQLPRVGIRPPEK